MPAPGIDAGFVHGVWRGGSRMVVAEDAELPDRCVKAESTGAIMVDVSELFWLILFIALPVASLVVLAAGLLCRRGLPVWLLWCAVAVPASALAILLVMLPEAGDDSLMLALIVWFVLCLLVLGLALGRRWRGERSRPLELAGLIMPFVALALLAGSLALTALTPPTPVEEHSTVRCDSPVALTDMRLERCDDSASFVASLPPKQA